VHPSHWLPLGTLSSYTKVKTKATFTRCKLARVGKVPGMRVQTFHASRIMEIATLKVTPAEFFITCMKRLRAHPRHFTRESQLASCKPRFYLRLSTLR